MSSRPRRSAAQRASVAITDMADRDNNTNMSSRSRRSADSKGLASVSRGPPSSSPQRTGEDKDHTYLTVKLPSSKLRQATASRTGNQISVRGSRDSYGSTSRRSARSGKKSYIVESSEDEDEEEEEEEEEEVEEEEEEEQDEIEVGGERLVDEDDEDEEMEDLGDEDADGEVVEEDDMDVDAEGEDDDLGEEDAEGDIDMDVAPPPPTIKISKPAKGVAQPKAKNAPPPRRATKVAPSAQQTPDDDDDDEELSDLESDEDDEEINATMDLGGEEDAEGEEDEDVDAEGEEIEVAEEDEEDDLESDGETPGGGSRDETPDLSKMTVRQRARFEEPNPAQYQALSNEIQAKKVFTAEEISMRRAEMARRRRNLSEKRNEEVKMETINKLLKKQAPKTNRKTLQAAGDETPDVEAQKPNPIFIRWVSSKEGSRIAITEEIMDGPAGNIFKPNGGVTPRKMVQEVS